MASSLCHGLSYRSPVAISPEGSAGAVCLREADDLEKALGPGSCALALASGRVCQICVVEHTAIIGAGFSKAISSHMPLTDDLGKEVLDRLQAEGFDFPTRPYAGTGFETWLSRLAEPQPDLSTPENQENHSLYLRISEKLREVLIDAESAVLAEPLPWWLQRLLGAWHFSGTRTVTTFNYDLLIEEALGATNLWDHENVRLTPSSILRFGPKLPYVPPQGLSVGSQLGDTFQLLKLHGSVDTFWISGDTSGVTINRWPSGSSWGRPVKPSAEERQQQLPDRVPFIVPPAAAKSSFYTNPVTRELWQQAGAAIRRADEVALVGYSLPMTDLVTAALLGERLRTTSSKVLVVNLTPDPVVAALRKLDVDDSRIEVIDGSAACDDYATYLEQKFDPGWDHPSVTATMPLSAGATAHPTFDIRGPLGVDPDHTLVLRAHPRAGGPSSTVSVGDAVRAVGRPRPRARIQWPDLSESFVAKAEPSREPGGAVEGLTLIPTAIPRSAFAPTPA